MNYKKKYQKYKKKYLQLKMLSNQNGVGFNKVKSQETTRQPGKLHPKFEATFREIAEMEKEGEENPLSPIENKPPVFRKFTPKENAELDLNTLKRHNQKIIEIKRQLAVSRHNTNVDDLQYLEQMYNNSKVKIKRRFPFSRTVTRVDPIKFLNTLLENIMNYNNKILILTDRQAKLPSYEGRSAPERTNNDIPLLIEMKRKINKLATLLYGKYIENSENNIIYTIFLQPKNLNIAAKQFYKKYRKAINNGLNLIIKQWSEFSDETKRQDFYNNTDNLLVMLRIANGFMNIKGVKIFSLNSKYLRVLNILTNISEQNEYIRNQLNAINKYKSYYVIEEINIEDHNLQPKNILNQTGGLNIGDKKFGYKDPGGNIKSSYLFSLLDKILKTINETSNYGPEINENTTLYYNDNQIIYNDLFDNWYYKYEVVDGDDEEYGPVTWEQLVIDLMNPNYIITSIWHQYYNNAMDNNGFDNNSNYAYVPRKVFDLDKCQQENYMNIMTLDHICKKNN